jgi:transcription elongation factor Elf1
VCFRCGEPATVSVLVFCRNRPYIMSCKACVPRDLTELILVLDRIDAD